MTKKIQQIGNFEQYLTAEQQRYVLTVVKVILKQNDINTLASQACEDSEQILKKSLIPE